MKTRSHAAPGRRISIVLLLLAHAAASHAAEQLANGSFDDTSAWSVVPPQTAWTCIANGQANLHPPGGYTGPVITQALSLPNAGGRKFHFAAVLSKAAAPSGKSISFRIAYQDAAGVSRQMTILEADNDTITMDTALAADVVLPLDAATLTGFGVHKSNFGSFTLQSVSLDLLDPLLQITSPSGGATYNHGAAVEILVGLDAALVGTRTVEIRDNGTLIGAAKPDSFIQSWRFPDGGMLNFHDATTCNYIHEDEYFFFTGSFANNRFSGDFSAHSIGGMASGAGALDFSFDANGQLVVNTTGDAPLGVRTLTGGKSSTCTSYRYLWVNPPAGAHSLRAVVTVTDTTTASSETLASEPVAITVMGPVAAPEIVVEQPADRTLADGAATVAFGKARVRAQPVEKSFIIRNTGTSNLSGIAVSAKGPHAGDFKITQPANATLAPGAAIGFAVRFAPVAAGTRTATLQIANNDADESPFDINLTGVGVTAPEIVVQQPAGSGLTDAKSARSFGRVTVGKAGTAKTFTIRNTGTARLSNLAITKNGAQAGDFVVTQPVKTVLAPGAATTFKVVFRPKAKGARNAAIHIRNNDTDENPFDIKLAGAGS